MISIITCSNDDQRFEAVRDMYRRHLGGGEYEIIRITDARSMCEGYNHGVARSRGDLLIFCHDDIELLCDDFASRLRGHLGEFDLVGVAGASKIIGPLWGGAGVPYLYGQLAYPVANKPGNWHVEILNVPARRIGKIVALDGVFMAARRTLLSSVQFDEQTFTGFHHYDLDFSYRAHLAGFKVGVAADLDLIHASRGSLDESWQQSAMAFAAKHPEAASHDLRKWQPMGARVGNIEEVKAMFHPPHWDHAAR